MNKKILLLISCSFFILLSCSSEKKNKSSHTNKDTKIEMDWSAVDAYYKKNLTETISKLKELKELNPKDKKSKQLFKEIRIAFKKAEPYISSRNPQTGHRVNGPALPIYKTDNDKVLNPVGLQKIEESVFEGEDINTFKKEIGITLGLLKILERDINYYTLENANFFIATHQQLLRIITHSITGFDTPVSNFGISEAEISINSLKEVYEKSIQKIILEKNKKLNDVFLKNIGKASLYLNKNSDFKTFDRYTFIKDFFNPIIENWVTIRKTTKLWEPEYTYPINFNANTFFEDNSFNINHFRSSTNRNPSQEIIEFGKKLFFNPSLSDGEKMSCATCHLPQKAYSDGLALGIDNKGKKLRRNTPTLINTIYQKSFFLDGRSPTIEDQISQVFNNTKEFNNSVHNFSKELIKDSIVIKEFENIYKKRFERNSDLVKPIASFISTLNGFNSRFDKNITGKLNDYTEEEKLGFNLFAGKALCATCHFLPLTNGTVPPFFTETEKEVIGVPETSANKKLDDDYGFYWRYKHPLHNGMFKTPTVRNIEKTAPYMHNGIYNTLEEVVDFYNKGGGGGLGFKLPHQTLPFDNLELTKKEQKAIVAFLKTLNDTEIGNNNY